MITDVEDVAEQIVDAALKLHIQLGPGLLESVYQVLLAQDLTRRGLMVELNPQISFEYDGLVFEKALRPDLVVNRLVVVELKAVERLAPVHRRQLLTYLRLLRLRVGLLLNFGGATLKEGLHRIINGYQPPRPEAR